MRQQYIFCPASLTSLHLKFIKYLKNKMVDHLHANFKAMQ